MQTSPETQTQTQTLHYVSHSGALGSTSANTVSSNSSHRIRHNVNYLLARVAASVNQTATDHHAHVDLHNRRQFVTERNQRRQTGPARSDSGWGKRVGGQTTSVLARFACGSADICGT